MAVATSNVIGGGDARSTQWLRSGRLDRPAPERIDSNQEISVLDFFSHMVRGPSTSVGADVVCARFVRDPRLGLGAGEEKEESGGGPDAASLRRSFGRGLSRFP